MLPNMMNDILRQLYFVNHGNKVTATEGAASFRINLADNYCGHISLVFNTSQELPP